MSYELQAKLKTIHKWSDAIMQVPKYMAVINKNVAIRDRKEFTERY